ncbi:MAG: MBL fold metallo-hydrolase [Bacteroidales bacterium]|nr:MBL fold metallo-hydrolase [Bacteroidales bacterium]
MGSLKLTFLGTGTSLGVPIIGCHCEVCSSMDKRDKRLRTSALIDTDKGTRICIDAGPDFRYQMLREKVEYLDAILITHEHRDHTAGLDDVRSFNYLQRKSMDIYGNKEALAGMRKMYYYVFENSHYPGVPEFNLHEINPFITGSFKINELEIVPIKVMHAQLPTLAYRIGSLAYITDAKMISPKQEEKLYGVETLVVNALRWTEHFSHFTIHEALALIEKVKPKVAYLTHLSHEVGPYKDFQQFLPDNVHLAYDGLQISVDY